MNITSNAGIYKYTNKNNGKVYIGQAQHIDQRYKQHLGNKVEKGIDGAIYNEGIDAFDFEILVQYPELPGEVLDYLEAHFIDKYDSYNKGYNLTRGNHPERLAEEAARTAHMVTFYECKAIVDTFKLPLPRGETVLFIGQFAMAENFAYKNNVTVISDSVFYTCNGANVIRAYDEDIIKELENMSKKHFDLIIANPPYGHNNHICKQITDYIIHNIDYDRYINCQPAFGYLGKGNDNYRYVDTDNMYFPSSFTGAAVNTSVAEILKHPREFATEEMFKIACFDKPFHKFFFENARRQMVYNSIETDMKFRDYKTESDVPENTFLFFIRSCGDGVHSGGGDYEWNVNGVRDFSLLSANRTQGCYIYIPMTFNTKEEFENFRNWWYSDLEKKGLMTKILHSTHLSTTHSTKLYVPQVDWSHPWTDEEILKDYGYTEKEIEEILK